MNVKEILSSCATCIGREDVVEYLKDTSSSNVGKDTLTAVSVMVRLLNIVICELASTYIPMIKKETVQTINGKLLLSNLSENAIEIVGVYNDYGEKLTYKISGEYLILNNLSASIEYKYLPTNFGLDDEVGYKESDVSKMTLSCGLAAEFCISEGEFEQAVMWHERFVDGVKSVCMPKNSRIKSRCWA